MLKIILKGEIENIHVNQQECLGAFGLLPHHVSLKELSWPAQFLLSWAEHLSSGQRAMERPGGMSGGRRITLKKGLASVCPVEGCLQGSKTQAVGWRGRQSQIFWRKGEGDLGSGCCLGVGLKEGMRRFLSAVLHYEWELPTSSPPLKETLVKNQIAFEASFGYPSMCPQM